MTKDAWNVNMADRRQLAEGGASHPTLSAVVGSIGAYAREAVFVAEASPDDGATLRLRWVNPAFEKLTGLTLADTANATARALLGPDTDAGSHAKLIDALSAWTAYECELNLRRYPDGTVWAQCAFEPIRDADGNWRWWVGQMFDITEMRNKADKLQDLSLIAQLTQDMVCVLDRQRRITWANASFTTFSGYTLEHARNKRMSDLLQSIASDTPTVDALVGQLNRGEPAVCELLSKRADGTRFLGQYEYQPVRSATGSLLKYVTVIRDITESRSIEYRYKAIFDETNAAISVKSDGRYAMVNRAYADLFDKTPDEIIGTLSSEVMPKAEHETLSDVHHHVAQTGKSLVWERIHRKPDGTTRHYMSRSFMDHDPVLARDLFCTVGTDITQIRVAEAKLRASQAEAQGAENRLWSALNAVPDGFVLYDRNDRMTIFNRAFKDMHAALGDKVKPGLTYAELLQVGLKDGLYDTGDLTPAAWLEQQLDNRDTIMRSGALMALTDGRWILCREAVLGNGERAGVRIDVTDAKHREQALRVAQDTAARAQSRLESAIMALDDGFSVFDNEDRLVVVNPASRELWAGAVPGGGLGKTFEEIIDLGLGDGRIASARGNEAQWKAERLARFRNPAGPHDQELEDGRIVRVTERKTDTGDTVSQYVDLTQQRLQERRLKEYADTLSNSQSELKRRNRALEAVRIELEHMSLHDALTGLANRRYLQRQMYELSAGGPESLHRVAGRTEKATHEGRADDDIAPDESPAADARLSVLHIDLDRFKQINDAFGHGTGDKLLSHAADLLRATVGPGDFVARVGGDEFVILCRTPHNRMALGKLARRIVEQMRKPVTLNGHECLFGASVGIAEQETLAPGEGLDQLLINADIALYRAKEGGRSRWAFYSEDLQAEVRANKVLADDLTRAVANGEFYPQYQPQVSAKDGALAGVEALLRWSHPTRGVLSPRTFIETAEDLRLQRQIDQMTWARIRSDDLYWQRAGLIVPRISINVSARRLRDPDLIADIAASGLDPLRLVVEILETVFVDEDDYVRDWNIDRLRDIGCAIELDDFGTGHSSIVGLIKLRPRGIKIDRHFVEQTLLAEGNAAVVKAMVGMGHSLGVQVIAEGVETPEHIAKLASFGCDTLQGFAFGAPMSAPDLLLRQARMDSGAVAGE